MKFVRKVPSRLLGPTFRFATANHFAKLLLSLVLGMETDGRAIGDARGIDVPERWWQNK